MVTKNTATNTNNVKRAKEDESENFMVFPLTVGEGKTDNPNTEALQT